MAAGFIGPWPANSSAQRFLPIGRHHRHLAGRAAAVEIADAPLMLAE
jgi:hypothetical protein